MIHWSSGREGYNNYRRGLVIWLVHLICIQCGWLRTATDTVTVSVTVAL